MTAVTHSIHVDLAPETAFEHIVDPTLVPPGIVVNTIHESPGGVGNAYEWTYRLLGIPVRGVMVYTQCVPDWRFACKYMGMVGATAVFTLEPDDDGTRLTRAMAFEVRIPLLGKLLEELMVKAADPNAERTVACPKLVDFFLRRGVERRFG
jgi:carbon monoxide dehydrogenase subunit G